jgi:hypothetical protein
VPGAVEREELRPRCVGDAVQPHRRVGVGELALLQLGEVGQPVDEQLVRGDGAAGTGADERRLADVVCVLMREEEQLDVLDPEAECREPGLEPGERRGRARTGVDERHRLAAEHPHVHRPDRERRREDDPLAHSGRQRVHDLGGGVDDP